MKGKITFLSLIFLVLVFGEVMAYPRFAAYTGDKCMDCHVNPTGGSMRNMGGTKFAEKNLNMEMFKKIAGKTQFSPKLTKAISIGGDVRLAQVDNQRDSMTNFNSFLQMQGDAYVNAQLNKVLNVFITSGIVIPNIDTQYEVYGMLGMFPANTYMKVGRFKPNYGMRIVEHRAYQRKYLLNAPYDANTGFELGVSPDWFNANIGLYNPMDIGFLGVDPHKMFTGSMDFTFDFKNNNYNFNFGGSFLNNPYNTYDSTLTIITGLKQYYGASTRIGLMKRVALLGEVDFAETKTDLPLQRSFYGFGELNFIVISGFEFRSQYEIWDDNRDVPDDDIQRISAGLAFFPFYGFETELMVRFVIETPEEQNDEFQWNFHFYF